MISLQNRVFRILKILEVLYRYISFQTYIEGKLIRFELLQVMQQFNRM